MTSLPGSGPLRVLFISNTGEVWGAERSLLTLAPHLADEGIAPVLAAPPDGPLSGSWQDLGFPTVPLRLPRHRGLRASSDGETAGRGGTRPSPGRLAADAMAVAASVWILARAADGAQAGVLHSNNLWGHLEVAFTGRLTRTPVVLELHDLVAPGLGRRLLHVAARSAKVTIAISEAVAACAGPRRGGRLLVLPQAVDLGRFCPGPADPDLRTALGGVPGELLIAILGRLDREKGVHVLVEAVSRLAGRGAPRLAIVGRPYQGGQAYVRCLHQQARDLLGERVRFMEPIDDVPAVLRSVDVLVNASDAEPFGLTVLEAQACGTPVIGTDAGGIPEFVEDTKTGLLVRPRDPAALAGALDRLIADEDLRRALGACARRRVEMCHDIRSRAHVLAKVYRRIARG